MNVFIWLFRIVETLNEQLSRFFFTIAKKKTSFDELSYAAHPIHATEESNPSMCVFFSIHTVTHLRLIFHANHDERTGAVLCSRDVQNHKKTKKKQKETKRNKKKQKETKKTNCPLRLIRSMPQKNRIQACMESLFSVLVFIYIPVSCQRN